MRAYRGVNETISSLLLNYIAIALLSHFVEGPMRDPLSLNKPSTRAIPAEDMLQAIPGLEVHWGLVFGIVACIVAHVLMMRIGLRLRRRDRGRQPARRDAVRSPGAAHDDRRVLSSAAARPASPGWPRSRPCTAARTPRS